MAVKKTETAVQDTEAAKKDTMDTQEKDTEVIHLFKDSQRYKAPVFVGVNGETYLIQRGVFYQRLQGHLHLILVFRISKSSGFVQY